MMKKLAILGLLLAGLAPAVHAADKGPTIVVRKDEHRIAGVETNGITRWTATVGQEGDEVSAVNQSGNTAMVSVSNKKTGKTRVLAYDAEKGILKFSKTMN